MPRSWGIILLAIFLLVYAFLALTNLEIVYVNVLQGILAAASAICLLLNK
jgi:hypothetical protein